MKFYVAGRFQSYQKVRDEIDFLTSLGHEVTYDWTRSEEFDANGFPVQTDPHELPKEKLQDYITKDVQGVEEADFFVLCADDSLAGAWVEMGVALVSPMVQWIFVIESKRWTIFLEHPKVSEFLDYHSYRNFIQGFTLAKKNA